MEESYTPSKTVAIFLKQISDPDYENTKEYFIENIYQISECIKRIRAKERRLGRNNPSTKRNSLSIRKSKSSDGTNDSNDMEKNKNDNGYYSVPKDIWYSLDENTQEMVKRFNGELRNTRKKSRERH